MLRPVRTNRFKKDVELARNVETISISFER
jgi:hypothetical protein